MAGWTHVPNFIDSYKQFSKVNYIKFVNLMGFIGSIPYSHFPKSIISTKTIVKINFINFKNLTSAFG